MHVSASIDIRGRGMLQHKICFLTVRSPSCIKCPVLKQGLVYDLLINISHYFQREVITFKGRLLC